MKGMLWATLCGQPTHKIVLIVLEFMTLSLWETSPRLWGEGLFSLFPFLGVVVVVFLFLSSYPAPSLPICWHYHYQNCKKWKGDSSWKIWSVLMSYFSLLTRFFSLLRNKTNKQTKSNNKRNACMRPHIPDLMKWCSSLVTVVFKTHAIDATLKWFLLLN